MYEMVSFDNVILCYDYFISVYVFVFEGLFVCVYVFAKCEERITSLIYRRYLIRFDSLLKFFFSFFYRKANIVVNRIFDDKIK